MFASVREHRRTLSTPPWSFIPTAVYPLAAPSVRAVCRAAGQSRYSAVLAVCKMVPSFRASSKSCPSLEQAPSQPMATLTPAAAYLKQDCPKHCYLRQRRDSCGSAKLGSVFLRTLRVGQRQNQGASSTADCARRTRQTLPSASSRRRPALFQTIVVDKRDAVRRSCVWMYQCYLNARSCKIGTDWPRLTHAVSARGSRNLSRQRARETEITPAIMPVNCVLV